MLINGRPERPEKRQDLDVFNPYDQSLVGSLWMADADDFEGILDKAQHGFQDWSKRSVIERADIIQRFAQKFAEKERDVATLFSKERGKTFQEALAEVRMSIHAAQGFAEMAKHLYGHTFPSSQRGIEDDLVFTRHEPIGIFLCIIPFNNPLHLCVEKMIPALLMGNAVMIKVPSVDPLALSEMIKILVESGVPETCADVICCDRAFGTRLIQSHRIQAVSVTGSDALGVEVFKNSATNLHRIFMELGGNDPFIILEDADVETAANEIVRSRLSNAGQSCSSCKRILVHASMQEALVEALKQRMMDLRRGDPLDEQTQIGTQVSPKHADDVLKQIQHTIDQGASCVFGGRKSAPAFVEPTILTDVSKDMDIAKDLEIFGPVVPLIAYTNVEEAIDIANQTSYGLQAGVLSNDLEKAFQVASCLDCGAVVVNGASNYRHVDMPFGGVKASGIGREGISTTLKEFCNEKTYVVKGVFAQKYQ